MVLRRGFKPEANALALRMRAELGSAPHGAIMPLAPPFCDHGGRNFDKDIHDEASWLGFALLVSKEAALHIVRTGWTTDVAARKYAVSARAIRMRINVTGARRRSSKGAR